MNIDERLEKVAVVGAAGKMGSGISLLVAQEMVRLKNQPGNQDKDFQLHLLDVRPEGLEGLKKYIEVQTTKKAKKKMESMRALYAGRADVSSDEEVVRAYVADTQGIIRTGTDLGEVKDARLVFEAVLETEELKTGIFKQLREQCSADAFFLSNTSSIPIGFLDREAGLDGRIIGFHFYNPPAVQKLVELISSPDTRPELQELAQEIGQRLKKIIVPANDIAGFIGNGHFIRDGLHALAAAARLRESFSEAEAIYAVNKVSQEGLLRPMGIFQLIDYVGIDVFSSIMKVMTKHIEGENFQHELIDRMVEKKALGGQHADGAQKDGFFQYEKNKPAGIYSLEQGEYLPLQDSDWVEKVDAALGPLAAGISWRTLLGDADRAQKLDAHFTRLASQDTLGAKLTLAYLKQSRTIGEELVAAGAAASTENVNAVLENGFYHLYGPCNDYAARVSCS